MKWIVTGGTKRDIETENMTMNRKRIQSVTMNYTEGWGCTTEGRFRFSKGGKMRSYHIHSHSTGVYAHPTLTRSRSRTIIGDINYLIDRLLVQVVGVQQARGGRWRSLGHQCPPSYQYLAPLAATRGSCSPATCHCCT